MQKRFKKRKGFSLVEIMIVVVIIAIVSAGAFGIFHGSSERAKYSTAERDLGTISKAFENMYCMNSDGQNGFGSLTDGDLSGVYTTDTDNMERLSAGLQNNLGDIKDPWGNEYQIKSDYDKDTNQGYIILYVDGSDNITVPTLSDPDPTINVRKNVKRENSPGMYRKIFDNK